MKITLPLLLVLISSSQCAFAEAEWPQFRGPDGQGHVKAVSLPLRWSENQNIRWKTPIPGRGWSSPVVSGDQIWLTTATNDGSSLRAICVDRDRGNIRHNVEVFARPKAEHIHSQNSHATPTPVIDADTILVHFGANGTAALSRDGEIKWTNTDLQYSTPHGSANSPVLIDELLIICCDGSDRQFLVALDKKTGKIVWRRERAHLEDARRKSAEEKNESRRGLPFIAFSTPLVVQANGTRLLVSTPADHVVANRVDTGEEVWWLPYNCFSLVARPVFGNGLVYAIGGLQDGHYVLYAIRPDGAGKLSDEHLVWKREETIPQCPSPLLVGDYLFLIKDNGIATCLNAASGAQIWQQRIGGNFRSSPIAVGDTVYCCSQEGKTTVIQLGPTYNLIATNQLDGIFLASPAVAGKSIFLRSDSHLYRIESQ